MFDVKLCISKLLSSSYYNNARFKTKATTMCVPAITHTLTLMIVGMFEFVPKGHATDPSILCENKTNFPYQKLTYVLYDKMVY